MKQTIDQVVRGSFLPVSIIIVGIGNEDFGKMETLDGDVKTLYSKKLKKKAARDIVQFVPYHKFKRDPQRLAKEVLAEIPKQLTEYFMTHAIKPSPK